MPEHDIQNEIRLKLSSLGYTVFRANVGKVKIADGRWFDTGLPRGFSDLFAVKDGRIYFFEVKHGKNKASQEQLNFIEQMRLKGCIAGVVYSMNDVYELLGGGL
jgi:hypothetical protein